MRRTPWTDEHDRLTAYAAPPVADASDAELDRIWRRVVAGQEPAPRRTRRRRRVVAGVAAVVVLLSASGVAAADLYSARTGRGPVDAEDLRLGGPGEKLVMTAPDYGQVVAEETADIPFPSDEARRFAVRLQVRDARGGVVSTGAVRAWVAASAVCAWANDWAVATRDGDEAGRAEATSRLREAPSWPAVVVIESAQAASGEEPLFPYLDELADAAEGRDLAAVASVFAGHTGYCRGLVPDLVAVDPTGSLR